MKNKNGFTLVELVIVIIIVGILSIVAVPIYQNYVKRAYLTEGKALIGQVITAQKIYYTEHGHYAVEGEVNADVTRGSLLDVDISNNKYFINFRCGVGTNFFSVTIHPNSSVPGNIQYCAWYSNNTTSGIPGQTIVVAYRDGTLEYL